MLDETGIDRSIFWRVCGVHGLFLPVGRDSHAYTCCNGLTPSCEQQILGISDFGAQTKQLNKSYSGA